MSLIKVFKTINANFILIFILIIFLDLIPYIFTKTLKKLQNKNLSLEKLEKKTKEICKQLKNMILILFYIT